EVYFYKLVINHEDMHSETQHHIRQTLCYVRPSLPNVQPPPALDLGFELHDVSIPGGTFMLGATPDMPFVLDNEKWAHPIEVAPFKMSATPVTQSEYLAFVEDGGYQRRELWSDEGWAWHEASGAQHPAFWERDSAGQWVRRTFDT